MDILEAIRERRSCRDFSDDPLAEDLVEKILEAGAWAPSPLNLQPWQFIVITSAGTREKIFAEAERCRDWAVGVSGWKWLDSYNAGFLTTAPVIVAVVGDPAKSGVDQFQDEGPVGYQQACAAAVQNMLLAAHACGIGSLWFTFYDYGRMRRILGIEDDKTPLGLVCMGKIAKPPRDVPRKALEKKVRYIR